jgi:MTH538 TIR-like domain (DUF1863)
MTTTADAAVPGPAEARPAFDAFISYGHAADGRLAPALQNGLQSMAKPWYRRRAMRIFRDQTTLSASPELWGSIAQALASSRAFILLAAPESAASPWVEQEAAWWRTHRERDGCLIALTGGELEWDQQRGDFSAGSSVPPSLRGTMGVWRPKTGTKLGELPLGDPQTGIERGLSDQTRMVFGRDGTVLTATTGAGLYAWSISPAAWTRTACATIGRSMTRDEWQRYLGIPYQPRSPC